MRRLVHSRVLQALLLIGLLCGAFGIWVLLHPGSFVVKPWRAHETVVSSRYIFGPYPLEQDFGRLEDRGVTTIISLLDPAVPYESVLLGRERKQASRYGIRVLNFPMGSVLGQKFGDDYEANAQAAAQAAIDATGVVYIHCYLGLHRARIVQDALSRRAPSERYLGSFAHGRSPDRLALELANIAFGQRDYPRALNELRKIHALGYDAYVLYGWTYLQMQRPEEARQAFERAAAREPTRADARVGLGFAASRLGDYPLAEREFSQVLADDPANHDATEGLGYVRAWQGRNAEARPLLERAVADDPENESARDALAQVRERLAIRR
jgi:tetratricopeptide (TPR) repeat protein